MTIITSSVLVTQFIAYTLAQNMIDLLAAQAEADRLAAENKSAVRQIFNLFIKFSFFFVQCLIIG